MENIENTYDLRTITPENLMLLLSTAKDELVKYIRCCDEAKRCKKCIEEQENTINLPQIGLITCIVIIIVFVFSFFMIGIDMPLLIMAGICVVFAPICAIRTKFHKKAIQNNLIQYKALLVDLQKKKQEAINEIKALLFTPDKYWDEYALTTMLEYVEDKEASDWERVTDMYKTHLHRAEISELSRKQTELARQTRNRAGWATAGAWASAAGIWQR